jgi:hypothetical protein
MHSFVRTSLLLATGAVLVSSGCARVKITDGQYRSWTAGATGCPSEEVVLSGQKSVIKSGEGMSWKATCRGRTFICSQAGCKEELQPAAPKPTAASASTPEAVAK